ncbi:MAG: hypothetical protein AB7R89_17480 [Dehalococcoidia bacterium]
MLVILVRSVVVALLAALCWVPIVVAFVVWGFQGGLIFSAAWLAVGLIALYWRVR